MSPNKNGGAEIKTTTTRTNNALLGALVIQNSVAVLVARYVSTNFNYDVRKMLLIAEGMKFFFACVIEAITVRTRSRTPTRTRDDDDTHKNNTKKNKRKKTNKVDSNTHDTLLKSLHRHVWLKPLDALKLSIPALLFLLMSILAYVAISLVPVPLFLIVQQTKLVKTTFLSVLLLGRSYSTIQWCSILALCIGSGICFVSVVLMEERTEGREGDLGDIGGANEMGAVVTAAAAVDMDVVVDQVEGVGVGVGVVGEGIPRWLLAPVGGGSDVDYYLDDDDDDGNTNGGGDDGVVVSDVGSGGVQFHILGLFLIIASNFCSSLAGVYFELVIKGGDKKRHDNKNGKSVDGRGKYAPANDIDFDDDDDDDDDESKIIDKKNNTMTNVKMNTDIEMDKLVGNSSSTLSMSDDEEQYIDAHVGESEERKRLVIVNDDDDDEGNGNGDYYDKSDKRNEHHHDDNDDEPSIWMRNIQLGFFTLCIIAIDFACTSPPENETPIFSSFNALLWIQIFLFAFGGLLIALVIRHADNVQKGLCMGISVVLTSALSIVMDGDDDHNHRRGTIPLQFVFGAILAIGGCFIFNNANIIVVEDRRVVVCSFVGVLLVGCFLFRDELSNQFIHSK